MVDREHHVEDASVLPDQEIYRVSVQLFCEQYPGFHSSHPFYVDSKHVTILFISVVTGVSEWESGGGDYPLFIPSLLDTINIIPENILIKLLSSAIIFEICIEKPPTGKDMRTG
jgi:hypothetical protein